MGSEADSGEPDRPKKGKKRTGGHGRTATATKNCKAHLPAATATAAEGL